MNGASGVSSERLGYLLRLGYLPKVIDCTGQSSWSPFIGGELEAQRHRD